MLDVQSHDCYISEIEQDMYRAAPYKSCQGILAMKILRHVIILALKIVIIPPLPLIGFRN